MRTVNGKLQLRGTFKTSKGPVSAYSLAEAMSIAARFPESAWPRLDSGYLQSLSVDDSGNLTHEQGEVIHIPRIAGSGHPVHVSELPAAGSNAPVSTAGAQPTVTAAASEIYANYNEKKDGGGNAAAPGVGSRSAGASPKPAEKERLWTSAEVYDFYDQQIAKGGPGPRLRHD